MIRRLSASNIRVKPIDVPEFYEALWRICGREIERDAQSGNGTNIGKVFEPQESSGGQFYSEIS